MKTIIFLAVSAAISLQVAAAVPHGHVLHQHIKKDLTTETITETEYVTASPTDPAVVVWVDSQGNIVSTETRTSFETDLAIAPDTPSSVVTTSTDTTLASIFTAPPPTPAAPPATYSSTAPPPPPAAPTSSILIPAPNTSDAPPSSHTNPAAVDPNPKFIPGPSATASTGSGKHADNTGYSVGSGLGIAYDLMDDSGACKSVGDVANDFDALGGAYSMVRIYSTDCNAVQLVTAQAAQRGMKVMAGISNNYLTAGLAANIAVLIAQAGSNLDTISTIAIGNEYVSSGAGPAADVLSALAVARNALAGVFGGSIVTVEVFSTLISNPQLCGASDYCAANCHAYFTYGIPASGAGAYVQQMASEVASANGGKQVIITESGWPWKSTNAYNTRASESNQDAAIASLKSAFSGDIFLFQGFDTVYKQAGDGTEWYFGIYNHDD